MLVREKIYSNIEHRFPVPGHTRLPCDRDFGIIEQHKKKVPQVYTPVDWCELIKNSNQKKPFVVTMMTQSDFYSFDNFADFYKKKLKTDDNVPVDFRNARCFKFTADNPNIMYVKHALNDDFQPINISADIPVPSIDAQIHQKYLHKIPLNPKKSKDLEKLLPFIPPQHLRFYDELLSHANDDSVDQNLEIDPFDDVEDI